MAGDGEIWGEEIIYGPWIVQVLINARPSDYSRGDVAAQTFGGRIRFSYMRVRSRDVGTKGSWLRRPGHPQKWGYAYGWFIE